MFQDDSSSDGHISMLGIEIQKIVLAMHVMKRRSQWLLLNGVVSIAMRCVSWVRSVALNTRSIGS
jgi:hypothetical protein